MSNPGERDDAPEIEEVEAPEVEAEVEETEGEAEEEPEEDGAEEAPEEGAEEAPAVAAKPRSAATIAVQEAKRAAKAAKEEAEATRRELNELRQAAQGRQTAEQARLEQERIALMAPEEKFEYLLNRQAEQTRTQVGALQFQMQDATDRSGFESLCARNPAFDAVRDDVERELTNMRRNGGNSTRETVATYLIGKRAIEAATKGGKTKQAKRGAERVGAAKVAAPTGRSDTRVGSQKTGGDSAAARAKRLDGQFI